MILCLEFSLYSLKASKHGYSGQSIKVTNDQLGSDANTVVDLILHKK